MQGDRNLIEHLRAIQIEWSLTHDELSKMVHIHSGLLKDFLSMSSDAIEGLPTVPSGLENALPLISIFSALQKLRPEVERQQEWLMNANEVLEGRKPIEVMMMSPEHLFWVSYTLEAAVRNSPA